MDIKILENLLQVRSIGETCGNVKIRLFRRGLCSTWDSLQKVDPHREEHRLGRNAHSERYEETIHDRTEKPVSENLQEKAHFENFVMGSDATEFVNQVRDQVRNRQKMSSIAESCTEHSIIW